jgi:hypothetical protein
VFPAAATSQFLAQAINLVWHAKPYPLVQTATDLVPHTNPAAHLLSFAANDARDRNAAPNHLLCIINAYRQH